MSDAAERPRGDFGTRELESEEGVHESLLGSVMDITLQTTASFVRSRDDTRSRLGELGLALCVGDRRRD